MGARNVRLVYAGWSTLPDRAFRVLAYMALVSLDEDGDSSKARRYYAGRTDLAAALGRAVPPEPAEDDSSPRAVAARRARNAAFEAVRGTLRTLRDAGALREVRRGGFRHQSEYELLLDVFPTPPQTQGESGSTGPAPAAQTQAQPAPTTQAQPGSQTQGEPVRRPRLSLPPRNNRGTTEEDERGQHQVLRSSDQGATDVRDDDEIYAAATAKLQRLGPEGYQTAMSRAADAHPDLDARGLVLAAAALSTRQARAS